MTLHDGIALAIHMGYRRCPVTLIRRLAPYTPERSFADLLREVQEQQPTLFQKEPTNEQSS